MGLEALSAVVLCGGLGTRLRSVVSDSQKTMAKIGEKPFLDILLDWASGHDVRRFVLCTGYKGGQVEDYFRGKRPDLDIVFSPEDSPLGTGGAVRNALPLLGGRAALILNGDSFCPLDLSDFHDFHVKNGGTASLAVVEPGPRRDGGFLELGAGGRVLSFDEREYRPGRVMNAGVYLLEPEALAAIPAEPCSLEKDVLPRLLERKVFASTVSAPLYDIGTPERWQKFQDAYASGEMTQ